MDTNECHLMGPPDRVQLDNYLLNCSRTAKMCKGLPRAVAQVSQPAVSQCFQPATRSNYRKCLVFSTPCRLRNRRYNRLGNLRYFGCGPTTLCPLVVPCPSKP